jgi:ADP-ribose pyrophosphatase
LETLANGRFVRLVKRDGWEYVDRVDSSGVVIIAAVTDDERLILVEQHRTPVEASVIELPAGLAGDLPGAADESLAAAAHRELLEETGYEAERMVRLTSGPPSAGLSTEIVTLYRASGLKRAGPGGGDHTEDITVHEVPLSHVCRWLEERANGGALLDPKIYAALYFILAEKSHGR